MGAGAAPAAVGGVGPPVGLLALLGGDGADEGVSEVAQGSDGLAFGMDRPVRGTAAHGRLDSARQLGLIITCWNA
ncbi:hypothetical protein [Streptomyces ardesiacus]|uniref:hypothetical protein n=1 Tax=Streptomyces ardesiacus TaxID=285564 RepID=UPI00367BAA5A